MTPPDAAPVTTAREPDGSDRAPGLRHGQLAVWVALLVALVVLVQPGTPPRIVVLSLMVIAVTLGISLRWRIGGAAVVVLLIVGVALRLAPSTGVTDVLQVTEAAVRLVLEGGNPWGHGYAESVPPGAPLPYGPLALLWYVPSLDDPKRMELLAALLILALLAVRGRPLGLAIYAVAPALVVTATDGSNDTSASLLLLVALLTALRAPVAGAVLLAVAAAFKPYALAWLPGLLAYAGAIAPLVAFVVASAVAWGPALLAWGPENFWWSFRRAGEVHAVPYYSLAYALDAPQSVLRPFYDVLRLGVGVVLAALSFVLVRSAASFIIVGALTFSATLFLGWWSTFAYLTVLAPVICWHIDDWLGLGDGRIVWPGDPVRAISDRVDARLPIRRPSGPFVRWGDPESKVR